MRLNDTVTRHAKPGAKPFKLFDGGGLYLLVNPNGSRWWKTKYYFEGVEKLHSIAYPDVSRKRESRLVAPRKAAASGRRSENQPIPPLAHAFQPFAIGSTSILDRSTFRGTEHAASPLIHG
jgi:hypothetical protein